MTQQTTQTTNVDPGVWDNNFGNWTNVGGLALKGFDIYNQYTAAETAKKALEMQKEQMYKNWAATQANAQMGWENKRAQQLANAGMSGITARSTAESQSKEALANYGLV